MDSQQPTEQVPPQTEQQAAEVNVEGSAQVIGDPDTEILKQGTVKSIIWEDVVGKGYDTYEFNPWLKEYMKEQAIAEGTWTLVSLKEAIAKFKETHFPQFADQVLEASLKSSQALPQQEKKVEQAPVTEEVPAEKVEVPQVSEEAQSEFGKEKVFVKKSELTVLNEHPNVVITIEDAKAVKGGVFGGDHVRFTIKTEPLGWVVHRKHKEFTRLKLALDKLHPTIVVPNISKTNEKEKFGGDSIKKRIYVYERFLEECAKNEEIKTTKFFVDFLSVEDREKFVPIKKAAEKLPKITRIDDLTSLKGEVSVDVKPEVANHSLLCEAYLVQAEPVYRDIKTLGKKLVGELNQASATLNEIGNRYVTLNSISNAFNKKVNVGKDNLEDVYSDLNKMIQLWSDSFQAQAGAIKKSLICFYKYSLYEVDAFKSIGQSRLRLQTEYEKLNKELHAKKEKLFAAGDPSKWEADLSKLRLIPKEELLANKAVAFDLMLEKETVPFRQFKDSYGLMNFATYSEFLRLFKSNEKAFKENITSLIETQVQGQTQMHTEWANFLTNLKPSKLDAK